MKKNVLFLVALLLIGTSAFAQNWDEMIKAVASDRAADDLFGFTISLDGNRAAVSSILDDGVNTNGATLIDVGAVYIYELSGGTWLETARLVASDKDSIDRFGCRISLDGDRILIGAYLNDRDEFGGDTLDNAGAAYIFDYIGGVWQEQAKLIASDRAIDDRFGYDVSLSGDKAAIGAFLNDTDESGNVVMSNSGAAYVFELTGGTWTETAKLVASDRSPGNSFGLSLSMSGETIMIGSYFNATDAAGINFLTQAGSAYVFEKVGGVWTETAKLVASNRESGDRFGHNVEMDENRAIIGAYNRDEAGIGQSGSAYIFERIGGIWTETAALVASDLSSSDNFGYSVDISGDHAIVGARFEDQDSNNANTFSNAGSAYVFELQGGVWAETTKIVASDRAAEDQFGLSVVISGDMIMTGAYNDDEDATGGNTLSNSGSVYFFNTCISNPEVTHAPNNVLTAARSGASYQWIDCDNGNAIIATETNQSFTPTANGNYAVIVTIGNCTDTSLCTSVTTVSTNDVEVETGLNVYPNPVNSELIIQFQKPIESLNIVNLLGETVRNFSLPNKVIDVSDLPSGIYFVNIKVSDQTIVKKIIKN
ncbi:MAG: T9SS type A sorting domain-containing protein [Crocinitomicaceae bacterium]